MVKELSFSKETGALMYYRENNRYGIQVQGQERYA